MALEKVKLSDNTKIPVTDSIENAYSYVIKPDSQRPGFFKPFKILLSNFFNLKADLVGGKVPASQLPSYVDDVLEFANIEAFPVTGETGIIYIALNSNKQYRWSGTVYVEFSSGVQLGETSLTAYRGDRGKTAFDHSQSSHAPANAEQNVQADWNQTNSGLDDFIKNKPIIGAAVWVYVGQNETYQTMTAAQTAGFKYFKLRNQYDITGTESLNSCYIDASDVEIYITGSGLLNLTNCVVFGAYIHANKNNTVPAIRGSVGAGSTFIGCYFRNNATTSDRPIVESGIFNNCKARISNYEYHFAGGTTYPAFDATFNTLYLEGTGSNMPDCSKVIFTGVDTAKPVIINDLIIGSSCVVDSVNIFIMATIINGIYLATSSVPVFATTKEINNLVTSSAGAGIIISQTHDKAVYRNLTINSIITTVQSSRLQFENCSFPLAMTLSNLATTEWIFDRCWFLNIVTMSARIRATSCRFNQVVTHNYSLSSYVGCTFIQGITFASGGSNNNITNCVVTPAGGSAYTITFNSGANNNIAIANQVDSAIVNSGTGNTITPNVVF